MDTRVIYAAAAASLDSWDIENLRYVKRKFSNNHPGSRDLDAVSYISEEQQQEQHQQQVEENLDLIQLPMLELDLLEGGGGGHNLHHRHQERDNRNHAENDEADNDEDGQRTLAISSSSERSPTSATASTADVMSCSGASGRPALDDCYLLDIVTVRNDSVLAFTPNTNGLGRPLIGGGGLGKNSAGSASSPSSSSSSSASSTTSSVESSDIKIIDPDPSNISSDKKRELFDFSLEEEEGDSFICRDGPVLRSEPAYISQGEFYYTTSYRRRNSACSIGTGPPSTTIISKENIRRFPGANRTPGHCPFCDQSKTFFNQALNLEDLSMAATIGGEEPPVAPNRSPSPYYVRLRRDLLTAITPPPHQSKTRPQNFSVNPHGQLAIDYSSNWLGLENYVKSLKFDKN